MSCDFHDAAAALVVDGELVGAAEEERFSRVKHDRSLPVGATESVLATAGMTAVDVDAVAFYERPLMVLQRYLATRQRSGPRGLGRFALDAPRLISTNLLIAYRLDKMLRGLGAHHTVPLLYADHHQSHAAAAFYPSPFERAAVLTIDGLGEWATASISRGHGHRLEKLEELRFPNSFGLLYSLITAYCGFRPNDDEYKVMGLAPYGRPVYLDQLSTLATVHQDGSLSMDAPGVGWFGPSALRRRRLHDLFDGPPRGIDDPLTQREADLAASLQALLETAVERIAVRARDLTGEHHLCMAGGVALNCVANGSLLGREIFEEVWVQPAAGDAGSAVGAALSVWHQSFDQPRRVEPGTDAMGGAFLGPRAWPEEVDTWIQDIGIGHQRYQGRSDLEADVAARLAGGAVVGWFQGRMEFGPRALGHRSILADPRSPSVRQEINGRVKGREGFRPFAPAVLVERAADWFDLDGPSPYMLFTAQVSLSKQRSAGPEPEGLVERSEIARSTIPACTHIDGSARVQTVDARTNPEFHGLLSAFEDLTDCPVLLNTSFNRAGEPIVATPDDALRTARAAGLDLLVVEHCVIELT